ncbi:MAG: electron transport complex subunit RsxC [Candidatus Palauibacterales bacterium]|nr:electron transport complex subunit RsxC [Candidatus Palauibacterales bacterium]MDP2531056.1 electron transport complex subunit RsxC [Candidatus Palauibacterales bacterium]MDP2582764.1 electron transport complex subunit RsxC [Candidatus Palauibacterales bacterium]
MGTFHHGVHPPELKELTSSLPIRRMPFPELLAIPLRQHAGAPARSLVKRGDRVERGDKVGQAVGFISSSVHASAAGTVRDVRLWPHPDGSMAETVVIEVDPVSPQSLRPRIVPEWEGLTPQEVVAAIQDAGVVGLGGAAFPAHVKLAPPPDAPVNVIVANGAECEPYLTSDHRTMVEYPERVHFGLRIMMHALDVDRAVIGVEANKPDAIEALRSTVPEDLDIRVEGLRVKYPQGAEKMMLESLLGRRVPSGMLPMHVGAVVQNVGSIAAIAEVFETGYPLIERIVTVTGPGIRRPANLIVPVGTRIADVLEFCGGMTPDAERIVFGGPMMGNAQPEPGAPVLKGTTGIVVLTGEAIARERELACIRCGRCLEACPVFLDPADLGRLARAGHYDEMLEMHLSECMLCGCCSYVCPSHIPLSQMFGLAKAMTRKIERRRKEEEESAAGAAA